MPTINEYALFQELLIAVGVAISASILLTRLRVPLITILLLAGALVGPHGLELVNDSRDINVFAEVGIVLLLFTIGLEFSLKRVSKIWRLVAIGGTLQVGLTIAATLVIARMFGFGWQRGIFFGFLIAHSSSAILFRALTERSETDSPHGRFIIGALIYQDISIVPMLLLLPLLAGGEHQTGLWAVLSVLGESALVIAGTVIVARKVLPRLFDAVDRTQSREVFQMTVLAICLGMAWLTYSIGLTLALGAFLAGLLLADSDYAHRAIANAMPFRDIFISFFFLSIGMLFDPAVILERPVLIAMLFVALVFGKGITATVSSLVMRFPLPVALVSGFGLATLGELGFVVMKVGLKNGLLTPDESRIVLAAGVLTMMVAPVVLRYSPQLAASAKRLRRLQYLLGVRGIEEAAPIHRELTNHIIVVGYGVGGQTLVQSLKDNNVPYLIIELDAELVREARKNHEPAYYGDIATLEALKQANVKDALALVLMINDQTALERALVTVKKNVPQVPVFVRTRRLSQLDHLMKLGATHVVVEEMEAGLEMLAKVLKLTDLSRDVRIENLRSARDRWK